MPSLKDLRNRIASVKATRKITKAMQMVAAAKLRRAQEAATAARPYAERMDRDARQPRQRASPTRALRPCSSAPARDQVHLLDRHDRRARPVRRLQLQHRQARARRRAAPARRGQDGQDHHGRPQGRRQPAPRVSARTIVDRVDLRGIRQIAFANADEIAQKLLALFDAGEFDVATLYFSEFKSVITQKPTALQLIPAKLPAAKPQSRPAPRPSTSTSPSEERDPRRSRCTRNISTQIFRGLLENAASEQGARMSAMDSATRNAGEMIDKLTLRYNRTAPGQHHQGADRDHLRRRGALDVAETGMAYTTTATTKGGRDGRAVLDDAQARARDGTAEGPRRLRRRTQPRAAVRARLVVLLRSGSPAARQEARPRWPVRQGHLRRDPRQGCDELRARRPTSSCRIPGADKAKLEALIKDAHEICPYSKATRGNIPVTLSVA